MKKERNFWEIQLLIFTCRWKLIQPISDIFFSYRPISVCCFYKHCQCLAGMSKRWLGCHAGRQEVSRCRTRGESEGTCNVTRMTPLSSNKAEPTLALTITGDVTRSPKQGYQWPNKKDSCPPKIFKKLKNDICWWLLWCNVICLKPYSLSILGGLFYEIPQRIISCKLNQTTLKKLGKSCLGGWDLGEGWAVRLFWDFDILFLILKQVTKLNFFIPGYLV